jgi:ribosomal protein L28
LKCLAREANNNGNSKAHAKWYSKRTFCKEVSSIAGRAGKHNRLKIVESALKREQGKLEKQSNEPAEKIKQKMLQPKGPATMTLCRMNP